jgi:hypothetical protein
MIWIMIRNIRFCASHCREIKLSQNHSMIDLSEKTSWIVLSH